jgi:hypothetical protein
MSRAMMALVLAGLLLPAPAESQVTRATLVPVTVEGRVQVQFHADTGTGCQGTCGLAGTATWSPGRSALLSVYEEKHAGKVVLEGYLNFFGFQDSGPTTTAHVGRGAGAAALCSDIRRATVLSLEFSGGERTRLQAGLTNDEPDPYLAASLFETRCGGPLDRDVAAALPVVPIDLSSVLRGGAKVDLSGQRGFAGGGFAGSVHSTVKLALDRPLAPFRPLKPERPAPSRRGPRALGATYRVERVTGSVVTSFSGSTERLLCAPLDVCDASGTVRVAPLATSGMAEVVAFARSRRTSQRQLRAALGLGPGRRVRGIHTFGAASWLHDAGSIAGSFTSAGVSCSDTAPLQGGRLGFTFGPRRVFVSYGRTQPYGEDVFRTRCPGPAIADAAHDHPLAAGAVPLRAFGRRQVVIRLRGRKPFESGPYRGETTADLTVVLRRVKASRQPEGEGVFIG